MAQWGILAGVNNPRVERLSFAFHSRDGRHDFSQAAPWDGDLGDFRCRLHRGTLEARPSVAYGDVDAARQALEPHLRAWELSLELDSNIRTEFRYTSAQVAGSQSTTGSGSVDTHAELAEVGVVADNLIVTEKHGAYPPPPPRQLATSPIIEELLGWVRDLREGRQRMLVLAFLCHGLLTFEYGGKDERAAAKKLNVSANVLETLRKLSHKNDPKERRKVMGRKVELLTDAERGWIEAVLPRLTRHVAEIEAGSSPPKLTMGDPDLPHL